MMKYIEKYGLRFIIANLTFAIILFIAGMVLNVNTTEAKDFTIMERIHRDIYSGNEKISIFEDQETGVNYIVVESMYGVAITPRLDYDGSIMVTDLD